MKGQILSMLSLRLEKNGKYQLITLTTKDKRSSQSEKIVIDKAMIHYENDWDSNKELKRSHQYPENEKSLLSEPKMTFRQSFHLDNAENEKSDLPKTGEGSQIKYILFSLLTFSAAWLLPSRKKEVKD